MQIVEICRTLAVVTACWESAEKDLKQEINENAPASDEEFITKTFHARFAKFLREASQKQYIASAFLADLGEGLPQVQDFYLQQIARGIVAEATLHRRATEKMTGGDLGLVLIRPQVSYGWHSITIEDDKQGLLCQAKLRMKSGRWGTFTPRQKKVLPARLNYLVLLLFQYTDSKRRLLAPFSWQLCREMNFSQVETSLRQNSFPRLLSARQIIESLGRGSIGTGDAKIIDEIISPAQNPCITIRI